MRAQECKKNTFAAAGSSDAFRLDGGYYQLAGQSASWGGGSLKIDQLLPDDTTWLASTALALTDNGVAFGYLPPGQYRFTLATTTAAEAAITRVPLE